MIREYIYFVDDNPNGTSGMTEEEIVRCKECKHKDKIVNYCYENDRDVNPDDFCSYGVKKGADDVLEGDR